MESNPPKTIASGKQLDKKSSHDSKTIPEQAKQHFEQFQHGLLVEKPA